MSRLYKLRNRVGPAGLLLAVLGGAPASARTVAAAGTPEASWGTLGRPAADTRPLLQLELRTSTGQTDTFYTYAETGATDGFDAQFDAWKLPNSTGLNLASKLLTSESLSIDGRGVFVAATRIDLTVGVPAAGTYTLAVANLQNVPAGLDAYLSDAQTTQTVKLAIGTSYAFSVTAAQSLALIGGRFRLYFAPQTTLATAPAFGPDAVSLFPNPAHGSFTVLVPAVAAAATVQADLLNALGQVVRREAAALPAAGARLTVPTAGLAPGVYTLRLRAGAATLARQVVVY